MCSKDGEGKKKHRKIGKESEPKSLAGCRHLMARRPEYRCCFLLQRASREKEGKATFAKPPGLAWRESDAANSKSLELAGSSEKRQFWLYRFPQHRWDFFFSSNKFHPWFALSGFLGPLVQLHPSKKPPVKTYRKLHSRDLMDCWQEVSNLALDPGTLYIFRFSAIMSCLCSLPVRWLSMFWFSSWEMWSLGKTTFGFAWSPWRTALIVNTHCVPGNTLGTLEASGNLTFMIQKSWHYNLVYA